MAAWVVGGLYALLGALQLAELGVMIPRSGGQYVFSALCTRRVPGFIVGWSDWISTAGTAAAVSIVIGEFSVALFPALTGRATVIAAAVIVIFAVAQWRGIRWGSAIQNVTSLLKALAFVALAIAAFLSSGSPASTQAAPVAPAGMALVAAFVLSLQAVIYTYDGWSAISISAKRSRTLARHPTIDDRWRAVGDRHLSARQPGAAGRVADSDARGTSIRRWHVAGVIFGCGVTRCSGPSPSCRC
jgi:amino acid transporter